ncbi:hypothetical protein PF005_g3596 [Phytophthora fragariae]|uniref:Calponin-homology (CH) domain-containing protein n=2 Tax=Phytophthora fragariae TaxID=53985 RepID=A0A6A3G5E0_9STRA|nr:hypothetical protein PF009_g1294 [Phytophthora fragariae]KAE9116735.1 hypothetical protein PF007_g9551 [Phytophthora fragariae]KAE9155063.1 hypothetical protein PF006_g960 [Phytophthora fragariae]KAE9230153.1 hypothetical protein PF005_g3596 [Phytophthora fragariae]KAE9323064.1 hypothetical protein PF001_g4098 [Phytophthora fragariae]
METLGCCEDCGSPRSSPTQLSVVTAEEQCSDGVRERLLLHWVNSLPLTKCLLVEELRDLRFGDVLFEVVQWLQSNSSDEGATCEPSTESDPFASDVVVERIRRVVQFAASECRSQDEDAMYVVNDAECVARVMEGRSDAICAVLTVLKRLSIQRIQQQQSSDDARDALHRRRVQEEMIKHSLQQLRSPPKVTEEMHVVNEWLTRVGLDPKKAANCGVLHDSMRNGSLLCSLLIQVLKSTSFPFFKTPRTLTEMRENISKAFEKLGELPGGQIPPCYLTASAEQAVLIGDRQVNYGILWHLWQLFYENRTTKSPASGAVHESSTIHPRPEEKKGLETEGPSPVHPSPLLLDIPAVALGGHGKFAVKDDQGTSVQVKLYESFARRLAWSESDPQDDDDDLFPVPKAPFSSPVYSESFHHESSVAFEYELNHQDMDILPVRTELSAAVLPSKPGHEFAQRAPSIALSELSGDDTATVVPAKMTNRSSDKGLIEPSPIKSSTAQAHLTSSSREPVEEILSWLKRLDINLKSASALHDPSATLTEFQSGVLLCCIVEKVELMRSMPGITRPSGKQSLSKASTLHNITKALAILQQKKTMPLHLLRRADAVYAGDRAVILQLLLQIRKAYGHHHHVPPRRPKQHPSAA